VISWRAGLTTAVLASVVASGCSRTQNAPPAPDPVAILQAVPSADAAQYDHIADMKQWRNPYLVVRADGVALYDAADSAEIILKPEEVIPALARLPASNWPYGRVVAVGSNGRTFPEEGVAIRRNKGIVGGMLENAHVTVRWLPEN
jgi:hypothetical protein